MPRKPHVAQADLAASSSGGFLREDFPRDFATAVSALLRTDVQARMTAHRNASSAEFFATLDDPLGCYVLSAAPNGRSPDARVGGAEACLLEIPMPVAHPIVERLRGGEGEAHLPGQTLTHTERRVLRRVVDLAAESLSRTWPVQPAPKLAAADGKSYRFLRRLASPDRAYTVFAFDVALLGQAGTIRLCIPPTLLGPDLALCGEARPLRRSG